MNYVSDYMIDILKRFLTYALLLAGLSVFAISCGGNANSANATNGGNSSAAAESGNATANSNGSTSTDNTSATGNRAIVAGNQAVPADSENNNCREAENNENSIKEISKPVKAKRLKAIVKEKFPHDKYAYTQGLFFENGVLYESCGQYGQSSLRTVDLKTGKVLSKSNLDSKYFAEGSVIFGGNLYLLTWREQVCFVYEPSSFKKVGELRYSGEGWGLTTDGKELIMSNGSATISFLDPMTLMENRRINVTLNGKAVDYINELEYINGEIWANVYLENYIVTIDPGSGCITSVIDCSDVYPATVRSAHADVLNGIAYNKEDGSIYITGKYWPHLYKITVSE